MSKVIEFIILVMCVAGACAIIAAMIRHDSKNNKKKDEK